MRHAFRNPLCALVALTWPLVVSFGQSPASRAGQSAQNQSPPQTQSQSQTPAQDKQDSVAEAARKAKEKKAAAKHKVLTEDDLSGLTGGVSVVGSENTKQPQRTPTKTKGEEDSPNGEAYWRGKAQPILQQIADIDQAIAQLKDDIKKYGTGGIDVTTGMKEGVAYVEDRNAQIQELQKKKAKLQKELDDLEEEGRKAGAQPAWFR